MQNPLVSILIPFKNTSEFLPDCLNSIIEQTYSHWEILAVDDGSSDSSYQIVEEYAHKDERIKLSKNPGRGIIQALRHAFNQSKGQMVTRMDSDDIMTLNKLEVMVNLLLHEGDGHVAVGQVTYFSSRGISNGYARYEKWLNHLTEKGSNYNEIYKECVIPSPCWMTYRDDLLKVGAFDSNRYPEDYDLTFRFYRNNLKCIPCHQVLHYWRDYDHRTSRTSEHYAQNYFLGIKLHYFLNIDYKKDSVLTIWGAGYKGKEIAKGLQKAGLKFIWLCDNPNKIGKDIYGVEMQHFSTLKNIENPQSIITVANEQAQESIKKYLAKLGHQNMEDYFFFC